MPGPIIDGEQWIARRLEFLRGQLDGDLPPDQRQCIEAEIDALSREPGIGGGPVGFLRFLRRRRRQT